VLVDRIRSELGHRWPAGVELNVVDLTAELRGELPTDAAIIDLTEAVSRVPHVAGVTSHLHLPGTPAPNTADARRASDTATKNGGS